MFPFIYVFCIHKSKSVPIFNIDKKFTIRLAMLSQPSYWELKNFYAADVIIVGSGIVGLNAAFALKTAQPALKVLIVERGVLPAGASTRNAGFACFGSISELIQQEKTCGTAGLHELIGKRWKGLQQLRALLGDQQIRFEQNGGFELFRPEDDRLFQECVSKLGHFNALISDIMSDKEVFSLANNEIPKFGFNNTSNLIKNSLEAQIDPGLMIKTLLAKVASIGVSVINGCRISTIEESKDGYCLSTEIGNLYAKRVILCNNAFAQELVPELEIKPGRGQVIVTEPIANLKIKGTFHYDQGYYYFRNIDDRILLGGGRNLDFLGEETNEFGESVLIQKSLSSLLNEVIVPGKNVNIDYRWSGIMAFGPDLHPIIKEIKPNLFCAVRCNGMGIAIGTQSGRDVAELVAKQL